jgi:hypothetical protein
MAAASRTLTGTSGTFTPRQTEASDTPAGDLRAPAQLQLPARVRHLLIAACPPRARVRRNLVMPIAASSPPPAMAASHSSGEVPGACGAVPPRPVAAPPAGMVRLPTASFRLWIRRPL